MTSLPAELEAKIDQINSWMFRAGSQNRIAKRAGVSAAQVSMVLNKKKAPSPEFLKAAEQVVNEIRVEFGCEPMMKVS